MSYISSAQENTAQENAAQENTLTKRSHSAGSRQFVLAAFALFALMLGATIPATAATCWSLDGFVDVIEARVDVSGAEGFFSVTGIWIAEGFYHMPIVGSTSRNTVGEGFRFGIHATNNSDTSFDGYTDCVLDATMDETLGGPWRLSCGAGAYTLSGTLSLVDCGAERARGGESAGLQ